MKVYTILLLVFGLALSSNAQDIKPQEKLILCDTLAFMGIDFSMAHMASADDVNQAEAIRDKHGPWWSMIGENICLTPVQMKSDMQKKVVVCYASLFDSSYTKLDANWIVASTPADMTVDQVSQHVKNYKALSGYRLGLVFIVDKMDKKKSDLEMYAVYLDLSNNIVVKAIRCYGSPEGFGYSRFWTTGVERAYSSFGVINRNYIQGLRRYFKKHPEIN